MPDGDVEQHPRWATVFEVAAHLRLSTKSVKRLVEGGAFPRYGRPRLYRYDLNEVDSWLRGDA